MREEELTENEKKMKQAKMLMILGVLQKYSDADNPISQAEIGRLVEKEYGVKLYGKEDTKLIRRYLLIIRDFLNIADFGYTLEHSDREKNVAHTFKGEATKLVESVSLHGWYLDRGKTNAEPAPLIDDPMIFDGESIPVEFIANKKVCPDIIDQITDCFGDSVEFSDGSKNSVKAKVTANEKAILSFALHFGSSVEILKPKKLRKEVAKAVRDMWKKYK